MESCPFSAFDFQVEDLNYGKRNTNNHDYTH